MGRQEDAFIEAIRSAFPPAEIVVGIGDDAAVLNFSGRLVITTDMMVEGVDFFSDSPLDLVGKKALAANLSDLAAMGSRPLAFLLTIALPVERVNGVQPLITGMAEMALQHGISLIGGDVSASPVLTISITAMGKPSVSEPLLRSSAAAGDFIYVSRPLGGSAAGLALYRQGWRLDPGMGATPPEGAQAAFELRELAGAILRQHLSPSPESELGAALGAIGRVRSCIDISDGLSTDLHRLCKASGVGAVLEWERIPIFPDLPAYARLLGIQLEDVTLHGGEEYALLFTSPLREFELSHLLGRSVYSVGRITRDPGLILERDGHAVPLGDYGHDHFSATSPTHR